MKDKVKRAKMIVPLLLSFGLLLQPYSLCSAQVIPIYMASCQNDPVAPILVADLPFDRNISDLVGNQYRAVGLYGYPPTYTIASANAGEPKALYLTNTAIQTVHDQNSNVAIGKSYTKSIWAYAINENGNDYGGYGVGHLISSFDSFSTNSFSEMFISEQGLVLTHGGFAGQYYVQPDGQFGSNEQILPVRKWTCFTVVYDSSVSKFYLYTNGALSETQPELFHTDWFGSNNAVVEIGDYASQYGGSYRPAQNVYLKYAKVWSGALTAQQVRESYNKEYNKFYNLAGAQESSTTSLTPITDISSSSNVATDVSSSSSAAPTTDSSSSGVEASSTSTETSTDSSSTGLDSSTGSSTESSTGSSTDSSSTGIEPITDSSSTSTEASSSGIESSTDSISSIVDATSTGTESSTDSGSSAADSASSGMDSTSSGIDSISSIVDSSSPGTESSFSGIDSSSAGVDSASSGIDSASSGLDISSTSTESNTETSASGIDSSTADSITVLNETTLTSQAVAPVDSSTAGESSTAEASTASQPIAPIDSSTSEVDASTSEAISSTSSELSDIESSTAEAENSGFQSGQIFVT